MGSKIKSILKLMDRKFMLDLNDNTKMIDLEPLKSASYKFYFGSLKKKYQNLNFKIISDEKKLMETPKNDHPYIILIILELKRNQSFFIIIP